MTPSWRQIELALIKIAASYGFDLDEDSDVGDKLAEVVAENGIDVGHINLTELAKDLEKELQS
jgi:hypothetical protein